jgi:hypothetical protein
VVTPQELLYRGVRIVMAPPGAPPFALDAEVLEEDTYLVLSADTVFRPPVEHPLQILAAVHDAEPKRPGSVLVTNGTPMRFLAVVHDLGRSPTWTEAWISEALDHVFAESEHRHLQGLALPPLGTLHGNLRPQRFTGLLRRALDRAELFYLQRLWILARPRDIPFVDAR